MNLQENMQEYKAIRGEMEAIKARAASEGRDCTLAENQAFNAKAGRAYVLEGMIQETQGKNTIRSLINADGTPKWLHDPDAHTTAVIPATGALPVRGSGPQLSADYRDAFYTYLGSNGTKMSAALYEGSNPAGGFIVPLTVEGQVVPLAPTDMGVRAIASVIPTAMDIKIPACDHHQHGSGKG